MLAIEHSIETALWLMLEGKSFETFVEFNELNNGQITATLDEVWDIACYMLYNYIPNILTDEEELNKHKKFCGITDEEG